MGLANGLQSISVTDEEVRWVSTDHWRCNRITLIDLKCPPLHSVASDPISLQYLVDSQVNGAEPLAQSE